MTRKLTPEERAILVDGINSIADHSKKMNEVMANSYIEADNVQQIPEKEEEDRPSQGEEEDLFVYRPPVLIKTNIKQRVIGTRPHGLQGMIVHWNAGRPRKDNKDAIWCLDSKWGFISQDHDGKFYLPKDFEWDKWGYHTGKIKKGYLSSEYLLGVEVINPGTLNPKGDYLYPWYNKSKSENDDRWHKDECIYVQAKDNIIAGWYLPYTNDQERELINLAIFLKLTFKEFSFDKIWGHDEIAYPHGRKTDPGGALSMTMPEFRAKIKRYAKSV